jgi:hypothetical protein
MHLSLKLSDLPHAIEMIRNLSLLLVLLESKHKFLPLKEIRRADYGGDIAGKVFTIFTVDPIELFIIGWEIMRKFGFIHNDEGPVPFINDSGGEEEYRIPDTFCIFARYGVFHTKCSGITCSQNPGEDFRDGSALCPPWLPHIATFEPAAREAYAGYISQQNAIHTAGTM